MPRRVPATRPLVLWADSIYPVVSGGKVATRPAQHGYMKVSHRLQNIFAEAITVGKRRTLFINSAINAAPQMLGKIAVNIAVDGADFAIEIQLDQPGSYRGGCGSFRRRRALLISEVWNEGCSQGGLCGLLQETTPGNTSHCGQ